MKTIGLTFSPELDTPKNSDDASFQCPHCEKTYKEQKYLDEHIKKKHSDK